MKPLDHLIIVPGHGVCIDPERPGIDDSWEGIFPGEAHCYVKHIAAGVEHANATPTALLIFSGGMTREKAGNVSEAESYRQIAGAAAWWGSPAVAERSAVEEYARDSFENLLFSIARYRSATGNYPTKVTVCGWGFKRDRFNLHRVALGWPADKYEYVGVNNPDASQIEGALAGEAKKLAAVKRDLYLRGVEWQSQRALRNPFQQRHSYRQGAPELAAFLDWLESDEFRGRMPWNLE